ncbi:MAG: hypothetical protein KJN90_03275, partial [Gammaproteobacteria bacterium]|nr:hypothetical protein [Gammaproteobacteria bacterium]
MQHYITGSIAWLESNILSLIASALVLLVYLVAMNLARPRLDRGVEDSNLQSKSLAQARGSLRIIGLTLTGAILLL